MRTDERIRIGFDCNCLISATLTRSFRERFERILFEQRIQLVWCPELIIEYRRVIFRPKFERFQLRRVDIENFIVLFSSQGESQSLQSVVSINRDPKDNYLLALARDGRLDYLISGDRDLLSMGTFGSTRICSLSEFELLLAQS